MALPAIARGGVDSTSSLSEATAPRSKTSFENVQITRAQQELRARMFHYGFEESALEETLDPGAAARVNLLLARLEESLHSEGFVQSTVDKTVTIASELLSNIKRHAPGSAAHFAMRCQTAPLRHVRLGVADEREGFDLDATLEQLRLKMSEGEREHGLLRVQRLSSLVEVFRNAEYAAVLVDIYERDRPQSKFFNIPGVAPILLEYENPKLLWLGDHLHADYAVFGALRRLTEDANKAVLKCYFGHLSETPPKCLFVEVRGHKTPTEQFSTVLLLRAALELYFSDLFANRRVVLLADKTESFLRHEVQEWAQAWGLASCEKTGDAYEAVHAILEHPGAL